MGIGEWSLITGASSGMGRAVVAKLRAEGRTVIGVDLGGTDIDADLGSEKGRTDLIAAVSERPHLGAVATFAGVSGFASRPGSTVVSINYFGTVRLLEMLRPFLAGSAGYALAVGSNTATIDPKIPEELVEACLEGDEGAARALGDTLGGPAAYSASKLAVARWVRRAAPTPLWAGAGVSLNALMPGFVETGLTMEMRADPKARFVLERLPVPIGRPAVPEEIAPLASLLLSDQARFIVGSIIFVDGGTDAQMRPDDYPTARRGSHDRSG